MHRYAGPEDCLPIREELQVTIQQIGQLMQGRAKAATSPAGADAQSAAPPVPAESARAKRPVLPPSVPQVFLPVRGVLGEGELRYEPRLVPGCAPHILDLYKLFCETYSL